LHLFARRLGLKVGRAQAILGRLQEAGVVSSPGDHRGQPIDLGEPEIVTLLISLLAESGIATSPDAAQTFGALTTSDGERYDTFMSSFLFGPPVAIRHLMLRKEPPGVSVIVDQQHVLFGAPSSPINASPARIVGGEALTAIAAELRGETPANADALAAITNIQRFT
jgi:hypothetical protein